MLLCKFERQDYIRATIIYKWSRRWPVTGLSASGTWRKINLHCCWRYEHIFKEQRGKKETLNTRTWWLSATLDLVALVCLPALSHSGRYGRTVVRIHTLLLCAGRIARCCAVLAARRYRCGYWGLVCAFVVCAEEAG